MPIKTQTASLRVLLLAGTGEAHEIATRLSGRPELTLISSLAGRVSAPSLPPGIVRIGGFGGVSGLTTYLAEKRIDVVIDATHPFAAKISRNAEEACTRLSLPFIALERSAWTKIAGDLWFEVPDMESATRHVAERRGRCLLTIGRQEVSAFTSCNDTWFLVRTIEPPQDPMPLHTQVLLQRGPFDLQQELELLRHHAIDYIVSKNSGGAATYSKIEAAKILGIPVIMIQRPLKHTAPTLQHVEEVLAALNRLHSVNTRERGDR